VNWRASLLGALIVAAAGLAVGVVIGGKRTTETVTVTAARATVTVTSTATVPETGSSTATTGPSTPPGSTTGGDGAQQQYLGDYLINQGTTDLNNEASGVSLIDDPSTIQLKGRSYQHAVGFSLNNYSSDNTFQMPAGFKHLTSSIIGLGTLSGASTRYRLKIYKDHSDTPNATVLYSQTFHGPSDTHPLDFDTQGATVLVLEWTQTAEEPDSDNDFIMADPVITR
jgi:hypothetical protein